MRALLALFLTGLAFRLIPFLLAPSLYLDEAMLGLSVATRDIAGLTGPLDFEQSAPVLFLWVQRLAVEVAGVNEHALRALPFLGGALLAPITWPVARTLLPARPAVLATALAAMSPLAVWYANVAKPYAVDAAVGAILLLLTIRVLSGPTTRLRWALLIAAGAIAPFLSAPSVFLLCGVLFATVLRYPPWRPDSPRARVTALVVIVTSTIVFNYLAFQGAVTSDAYLQRFYDRAFPWPPDPTLPQRLSELVSGMTQLFFFGRRTDVPAPLLVLTVGVCVVGLVDLCRRHGRPLTALVTVPFVAVATAAVLRQYPPVERLLLFLTPILALIAAGGLHWLTERLPPRARLPAFWAAAGLLLAPGTVYDVRNALRPHGEGAEVGPILAAYEEARRPGEPAYVYSRAVPVWAFYTTDWSHPDHTRLNHLVDAARRIGPNSGNAPPRGRVVEREGFDLTVAARDHVELIGIATGVEILYGRTGRLTPDPGWADNEVRRMREATTGRIWVFLSHHSTEVAQDLEAGILRGGGVIAEDRQDWGVRLWAVDFPPTRNGSEP